MIYVDPPFSGPNRYGNTVWSHMGTDDHSPEGLAELHAMATAIGLRRYWFENLPNHPHYDLSPAQRFKALANGADEVDRREYARKCKVQPESRADTADRQE